VGFSDTDGEAAYQELYRALKAWRELSVSDDHEGLKGSERLEYCFVLLGITRDQPVRKLP
jgi:hypothetical protein